MNDRLNIFEGLLNKFAFRESVPVEARRFALNYKRKALEITLKHFGELNLFYGYVLRVFFSVRKAGFNISVLQSKILLSFIILIASGAVYASVIYYTDSDNGTVTNERGEQERKTILKEIKDKPDAIKKEANIKEPVAIKYRFGVQQFTGDVIDVSVLNRVTDSIADKLIKREGRDSIVNLKRIGKYHNYNRLLTGSVERLGMTYIITAKIIDVESSKVLYVTTEEAASIEGIEEACSLIIERIKIEK